MSTALVDKMSAGRVAFKAFLEDRELEGEREVRRFQMKNSTFMSFSSLKERLHEVFPQLQQNLFSVSWQDTEGDMVTINSDEELEIALTELELPYKLRIAMAKQTTQNNPVVKSRNISLKTQEQSSEKNNSQCKLCNEFGEEGVQNFLKLGQPTIIYPRKLLKKIEKFYEKAAKKHICSQKCFAEIDISQQRSLPPPYVGIPSYGTGRFRGSVKNKPKGKKALGSYHGGSGFWADPAFDGN